MKILWWTLLGVLLIGAVVVFVRDWLRKKSLIAELQRDALEVRKTYGKDITLLENSTADKLKELALVANKKLREIDNVQTAVEEAKVAGPVAIATEWNNRILGK